MAAVVGVAGVSAASTLRNRAPEVTTSEGAVTAAEPRPASTAKAPAEPLPSAPIVQQSAPAATPDPAITTAPRSGGGFVLVEGRTKLTDSIYAIRSGDSVIVNFDAYGFRTRRPDKLESTLRLTLPMVFGRMATTSFDSVKQGQLVTNRDVVGSLAATGMTMALDNGATVRIRTLTRVGRDGALAVGYLALIER